MLTVIATLIKFINKYELEFDWRGKELLVWINYELIDEFLEIINYEPADCDIQASLQKDCAVVDLVGILARFDCDAEKRFPRELFRN